jgi:hypothetical protein
LLLQTGAFVPIHPLGEEKHAYRRLMLSSLIPITYVQKPERELQMHFMPTF